MLKGSQAIFQDLRHVESVCGVCGYLFLCLSIKVDLMLIHFPADFGKNGSKKDGESGRFFRGLAAGCVARTAKLSGRH